MSGEINGKKSDCHLILAVVDPHELYVLVTGFVSIALHTQHYVCSMFITVNKYDGLQQMV